LGAREPGIGPEGAPAQAASVSDAWYAALAIEWGREWVTYDRDFLKFRDLNCMVLPRPAVERSS
jgi:hypothetical protein